MMKICFVCMVDDVEALRKIVKDLNELPKTNNLFNVEIKCDGIMEWK